MVRLLKKLEAKERISVYGGIVFLSKNEKDKFITQYRSIINSFKCNYCKNNSSNCNNNCPEIKNTNIHPNHKRWIMNYIKKYFIIGLVINNDLIYNYIKDNKAAKGRFIHYSIRWLIKEIIESLITSNKIDPYKPISLTINIDQQTTKSNGYYNLKDGIIEELKHGKINYNYSSKIDPIIYSELNVDTIYCNSYKNYGVQATDLVAGTLRKKILKTINEEKTLNTKINDFLDFYVVLP